MRVKSWWVGGLVGWRLDEKEGLVQMSSVQATSKAGKRDTRSERTQPEDEAASGGRVGVYCCWLKGGWL